MKYLTRVGLALVLGSTCGQVLALTASVSQQKVAQGDSFQLILSSEHQQAAPDVSVLSKDFKVLGSSQSMQQHIINGRRNSQISWTYILSPKGVGKLHIPAISAGGETSKALSIEVVSAAELPKSVGIQGVSLNVELPDDQPAIYQEMPLTLRIESAHSLQGAGLSEPSGEGFELVRHGEDKVYTAERGGKPLQVIERHYLLKPQREGALSLPPFVLRGELVPQRRQARSSFRFDPFSDFGFGQLQRGKPYQVRSDILELDVQPAAAEGEWFLPAKAVELSARWQQQKPAFVQGQAQVRQVDLIALGASAEQLPELSFAPSDTVKIYVDDKETKQIQTPQGTAVKRTFTLSIVPLTPGAVEIPGASVDWYNTQTKKQARAELPSQQVTVAGAPGTGRVDKPKAAAKIAAQPTQAAAVTAFDDYPVWTWALGLAVLCVLTLVLLRRSGWPHRSDIRAPSPVRATAKLCGDDSAMRLQVAEQTLRKAMSGAQSKEIYSALLNWLRLCNDPRTRAAFKGELDKLEAQLFADTDQAGSYDSRGLQACLARVKKTAAAKPSTRQLPALYPSGPVTR